MSKNSKTDVPPLSPDAKRLWDKLHGNAAAPTVTSTTFWRGYKSHIGKKGAAKRWEGQASLSGIIQRLAGYTDALGDPLDPHKLWPMLWAALDDEGAKPRDLVDRYVYEGGAITYDTFRRAVQRARQ